jgi:predicted dehydrogenase
MTDKIRVGVVGAGAITQVAHLGALSRIEDVEVVAICDIDVPKAQSLALRFGIPDVYDDIEDLLRYAAPQAVAICTPNHLHEIHVRTALSAGAHVLCERPLALTVEGIERVRAARERRDRVAMVGMNLRYRSDVQAVRQFLVSKELGALHAIRGGWYMFRPPGHLTGWRRRRAESGGGAMLDLGLPVVDLALWLAGCPKVRQVSAAYAAADDRDIEDSGCALLRCDGGLTVFVDVSWRHIGPREKLWFELLGSQGSASLVPFAVYKEMHGTPMNVTPGRASGREDAFTVSFRAEWAHFLATVRGEQPGPKLEDQLTLHRTMEAITQAAHQGRDVTL